MGVVRRMGTEVYDTARRVRLELAATYPMLRWLPPAYHVYGVGDRRVDPEDLTIIMWLPLPSHVRFSQCRETAIAQGIKAPLAGAVARLVTDIADRARPDLDLVLSKASLFVDRPIPKGWTGQSQRWLDARLFWVDAAETIGLALSGDRLFGRACAMALWTLFLGTKTNPILPYLRLRADTLVGTAE